MNNQKTTSKIRDIVLGLPNDDKPIRKKPEMAILAKKTKCNELFEALEPELRKYFTFPDESIRRMVLTIDWSNAWPTLEVVQQMDEKDAAKFTKEER